jgi:hypothetical protein
MPLRGWWNSARMSLFHHQYLQRGGTHQARISFAPLYNEADPAQAGEGLDLWLARQQILTPVAGVSRRKGRSGDRREPIDLENSCCMLVEAICISLQAIKGSTA